MIIDGKSIVDINTSSIVRMSAVVDTLVNLINNHLQISIQILWKVKIHNSFSLVINMTIWMFMWKGKYWMKKITLWWIMKHGHSLNNIMQESILKDQFVTLSMIMMSRLIYSSIMSTSWITTVFSQSEIIMIVNTWTLWFSSNRSNYIII